MADSIRLGRVEQCGFWRDMDDFGSYRTLMTNPKKAVLSTPHASAAASSKPVTVEEAIQWQSIAQLHRAQGDLTAAASMEARAAEVLDVRSHVTGPVTIGNGNEVAVATRDSIPGVIDTVREHRNMVTARASHARLALTGDALILAADAANSVNAANSLEKMLAHQLAASHRLGMKFIEKAGMLLSRFDLGLSGLRPASELQVYSVEAARLANAGARMMSAYTDALLALDRVRRGGKQTVTVIHQHVAIGPGGQAVVAGRMKAGGARGHRRRGRIPK
jgi:hypothetical protein